MPNIIFLARSPTLKETCSQLIAKLKLLNQSPSSPLMMLNHQSSGRLINKTLNQSRTRLLLKNQTNQRRSRRPNLKPGNSNARRTRRRSNSLKRLLPKLKFKSRRVTKLSLSLLISPSLNLPRKRRRPPLKRRNQSQKRRNKNPL